MPEFAKPDKCSFVRWHESWLEEGEDRLPQVGDVVWNPKGSPVAGHVLVGTRPGLDGFDITYCECGEVDVTDHHVYVIERWNEPETPWRQRTVAQLVTEIETVLEFLEDDAASSARSDEHEDGIRASVAPAREAVAELARRAARMELFDA